METIFHHPYVVMALLAAFYAVAWWAGKRKRAAKRKLQDVEPPPAFSDPYADPYVLRITNTGALPAQAVIFGFNRFYHKKNFGSHKGIVIENMQSHEEGYESLLAQSMTNPFKIGKARFHCSKGDYSHSKVISIHHGDADGKHYTSPWILDKDKKAELGNTAMWEEHKKITVDARTYLTVMLDPGEEVIATIYPMGMFSPKAVLNGGQLFSTPRAPKMST